MEGMTQLQKKSDQYNELTNMKVSSLMYKEGDDRWETEELHIGVY